MFLGTYLLLGSLDSYTMKGWSDEFQLLSVCLLVRPWIMCKAFLRAIIRSLFRHMYLYIYIYT